MRHKYFKMYDIVNNEIKVFPFVHKLFFSSGAIYFILCIPISTMKGQDFLSLFFGDN